MVMRVSVLVEVELDQDMSPQEAARVGLERADKWSGFCTVVDADGFVVLATEASDFRPRLKVVS